ncbi:MAG: metallophosphoesterase [Lachnospiraceae bacterium]|nr:metallophosphoesterase [Lachnospiraceae bacterium]
MEMYTRLAAAGAGLAAAAAGGLLRSRYERNHFVTEEVTVVSKKVNGPATLVFLADLHDKEFGQGNERLLAAIRQAGPDAVLIGGDTMVAKEGKATLEVTERLLQGLSGICPVYYGNGNHEQRLRRRTQEYGDLYQQFCRLLDQYGITYLGDSSAVFREDIRISGLDIDRRFYRDFVPEQMQASYIQEHVGAPDPRRFQILLAHSPLFHKAYADWGADLALAGHFHGGTIRLPVLGGVMSPQYQFFLPCCAGTFQRDHRYMIVSRGLGTHSINIRFRNRPQVVVVKLLADGNRWPEGAAKERTL